MKLKMIKKRLTIMTITLGMITLVLVVVPAVVARNERLAILDLTLLIKSINGVAQGNVKRDIRIISLITYNICNT